MRAKRPKAEQKRAGEKKSAAALGRNSNGKFLKGVSGNPAGRPHVAIEARELARGHGVEAIQRLAMWMRSNDSQASIAAAKILLDRGYGKAFQHTANPAAPLVNLNFTTGTVSTPEEAARVYEMISRDATIDTRQIKFAALPDLKKKKGAEQ